VAPHHPVHADLPTTLDDALVEIVTLRSENAQLKEMIEGLKVRVDDLEERLRRNSTNSSKPPSSDGYAKRAPRSRRIRSGRMRGKQPGAPGAHLAQVAVPDQVVVHAPEQCARCGLDLDHAEVVQTEARQLFDLPLIRLMVIEHRAQHRRCGCGTVTAARFPAALSCPAQYGPGVLALGTYLGAYQHVSIDRIAQMLADCFGATVSTGTLVAHQEACAITLAGFVEEVRDQLTAAPVAHFDETGARVNGALSWIHSASTPDLTLYTAHARRGAEGMEAAGVLPNFTGVAVHDGWAAYRRYGSDHGLCNAHHLRELIAAAEHAGQGWAESMIDLLVEMKTATDIAKGSGRDHLDASALAKYRRRYGAIITTGHTANPVATPTPPGGRRPARTKAANLVERLDLQRDDVLRFAHDFRVPFDNNLAERDIRMVKVQQKVSGCWRSPRGAERFCAIRSYISTARKQRVGVLSVLREAFEGRPWLPVSASP
jgi:transposase